MSEFHDVYPDYEGMAQHDEAAGKKIRKKLWMVFWLLLVVTIFEVVVGFFAAEWGVSKTVLKFLFIGLTLVKAGYIVMVFMHLGHESKWTKYMILVPYAFFIIYLFLMMTMGEGNYVNEHRHTGHPANGQVDLQTHTAEPAGAEHH